MEETTNKVIGIIGSRRRDSVEDFKDVWKEFSRIYEKGDSICSGLCPLGGDRFAVIIADRLGLPDEKIIWFPPEWEKYGKIAGFIRNTDIAKTSDVLIACVADDRTGGTEDTIKKFLKFHGEEAELILV